MAIELFDKDISVHQKMGNEPNYDNNLTAEELKKLFDMPVEEIVKYINETIVPLMNNLTPGMSLMFAVSAETPKFNPVLWFDISGQTDDTVGVLKYIDQMGAVKLIYPIVNASAVHGLGDHLNTWGSERYRTFVVPISTGWTAEGNHFVQTVPVPGLMASDTPLVGYAQSTNLETAMNEEDAIGAVYSFETGDGFLKAYSTEQTAQPFRIKLYLDRNPSEISDGSNTILTPGPGGEVAASVNGQSYDMANTEIGKIPSGPQNYCFEIL